jgi:hypothetical protein
MEPWAGTPELLHRHRDIPRRKSKSYRAPALFARIGNSRYVPIHSLREKAFEGVVY